jgi:hypothetical protein
MAIWNILRTFVKVYDHLVRFCVDLVFFSGFGVTYQEKSGNPASNPLDDISACMMFRAKCLPLYVKENPEAHS